MVLMLVLPMVMILGILVIQRCQRSDASRDVLLLVPERVVTCQDAVQDPLMKLVHVFGHSELRLMQVSRIMVLRIGILTLMKWLLLVMLLVVRVNIAAVREI